ncbi:DEAD-like helicase [Ascosphaera apis ARSEF 7405]|uniref:ATP-dependent RNA helicase DBP10 n=1 Tax=Ascosphaera apis ARSEF 7405 TaxID=392613 RepID=A0A167VM15_9EURO|nr:DEAD-like helicase [Ascosphaera apis ARSEF 7405]
MAFDREVSPAMSENEFDISKALFNDQDASDFEIDDPQPRKKSKKDDPLNFDLLNSVNIAGGEDDSEDDDATFIAATQAQANRKAANLKGRTVKKGGGFQAMGLNANLLKAITRKGYSVPTPIQRKTIPLVLDDQDVVGMARTGSGKTAAFVIPMIEKLKSHSARVGSRALILSPSRELALQTMKVVKEMGRGTDLKTVLLVGGDSLEDQFGYMTQNPDILIATPGRFLHLKVEMNLDISSIKYVVFDEADRLFEMGFAAQLAEILHGLPPSRQTLLFSATLPKSLVEFARAGLQEPTLIRLDAESKISPDLQNAFFTVKSSEKEGALLHILHDVIKIPTGETDNANKLKEQDQKSKSKKRKRPDTGKKNNETPTEHSTIVFVATKHHVDYVTSVLRESGFAVSYAYGSLDQTARKIEVQNFRSGLSHILVVTDVAARGIDIPILANVINYDFPSQAKIFIHRVGRTARAGQKGWSYSLIRDSDAPYLLDLQLFLGRPLVIGRGQEPPTPSYTDEVVVGSLPRDAVARHSEWVSKLIEESVDIDAQRSVSIKGEKLYNRTRNAASAESAKRAKNIIESDGWMMLHPLFKDETSNLEVEREKMLARIGGYKPSETIFEVAGKRNGKKEDDETMDMLKRIRTRFDIQKQKKQAVIEARTAKNASSDNEDEASDDEDAFDDHEDFDVPTGVPDNMSEASDSELEVTFSSYSTNNKKKSKHTSSDPAEKSVSSFQNPEYFMSYTPTSTNMAEDRAYGVHSGANVNFAEASRHATMDLTGDESASRTFGEPRSLVRWDKRHKKYVSRRNDEDGSKGGLLVRGESGVKIAASFRSGKFDSWKKSKRIGRLPRVGETENPNLAAAPGRPGGRRFRHNKEQAPKMPDKLRGDYEVKKRKMDAAKQREQSGGLDVGEKKSGKKIGGAKAKSELKNVHDIRKARDLKERRRDKNARPSKKGKR